MPAFDCLIGNISVTSRVYIVICILAHFMRYVCPRSSWMVRLGDLVRSFPNAAHANVKDMGFPKDWEQHKFWEQIN